jgi:hypothetical protein
MNPAGQIIGVLLVIAGLMGAGALLGRHSRQDEIDLLKLEVQAQTLRADGEASTLKGLKSTLQAERDRRAQMQRAAADELAALTDRVAALTRAAERTETDIRTKANHDEDCAALRDLAVCAAVADGLWTSPTAASTH